MKSNAKLGKNNDSLKVILLFKDTLGGRISKVNKSNVMDIYIHAKIILEFSFMRIFS
jgi:hypothetical protein